MDSTIPIELLRPRLEQRREDKARSVAGYTWTYVIHWQERGPTKIGVAEDIRLRLTSLQGGNPFELRVFTAFGFLNREHAFEIEGTVLRWLKQRRLMGEWFSATPIQVRDTALRAINKEGLRHRPWEQVKPPRTNIEALRARMAMDEYHRLRDE